MPKKIPKIMKHINIDANDPRIIAARIAGTAMAEEYAQADSWYLLPPEFPTELLVGSPLTEQSSIMKAWFAAFSLRCEQIDVEITEKMRGPTQKKKSG